MAFWDDLKTLDSKFSWSFVGVLLAILGIAIGVYFSLRTPVTEITYDIINESNVLDVHKQVESLDVFFQNENIRDRGLNIRVLSVVIENTGDTNIKQVDFDQNENWGLKIDNGKIVNASFTGFSSDYLKNNLLLTKFNDELINLPKIMFDRSEKIVLDILVLHENKLNPNIEMIGKISGIDKFKIKKSFTEKKDENWLGKIFEGSFFLQLGRLVVFFFIGMFLLFILIVISEKYDSYKNEKVVRRREEKFKKFRNELSTSTGVDVLTDVYLNSDLAGLKRLQRKLSDPIVLTELVKKYNDDEPMTSLKSNISIETQLRFPELLEEHLDFKLPTIIQTLMKSGSVILIDDQWVMSQEFKDNLNNSIEGLK